jgi:hypothetical protein
VIRPLPGSDPVWLALRPDMNEILRETLRALRDAGLKPRVEQGRHIKVRFADQQRHARMIVISRTPGTTFALQKNRALLRRILRGRYTNGNTAHE